MHNPTKSALGFAVFFLYLLTGLTACQKERDRQYSKYVKERGLKSQESCSSDDRLEWQPEVNPSAFSQGGQCRIKSFSDYCQNRDHLSVERAHTVRAILAELDVTSCAAARTKLSIIEELDLSNRALSDITALAGLSGLQRINLAGNQIEDIWALGTLTGLREFDLTGNPIDKFPESRTKKNCPDLVFSPERSGMSLLMTIARRPMREYCFSKLEGVGLDGPDSPQRTQPSVQQLTPHENSPIHLPKRLDIHLPKRLNIGPQWLLPNLDEPEEFIANPAAEVFIPLTRTPVFSTTPQPPPRPRRLRIPGQS